MSLQIYEYPDKKCSNDRFLYRREGGREGVWCGDTAKVHRESMVQSKRATTTTANLKNDNAEITSAQMSDVSRHKKRVVTALSVPPSSQRSNVCLAYLFHLPNVYYPLHYALV